VRPYILISCFVVSIFALATFSTLPRNTRDGWNYLLPSQFVINQRLARGSTQLPNGTGVCGAVIYQLSEAQTEGIRRNGAAALPSDLIGPDGLKYGRWGNTPLPRDMFERYVFNSTDSPVGLNCGHGGWEKEWRANAQMAGNYYSTNGKALILLKASELQDHPEYLAALGYFYNP
jgi:hypothetical protein